jgi:N-acetylneuraminic acid mutarotase
MFGGRNGSNQVANGFDDVLIYDPATNAWTTNRTDPSIPPLPQARGGMGKAVYLDGEFYVIGGETQTGAGATPNHVYQRVDVYNPSTRTWRLAAPLPTARHGIFPLPYNGRIYVACGGVVAGTSASKVLEIYSPG